MIITAIYRETRQDLAILTKKPPTLRGRIQQLQQPLVQHLGKYIYIYILVLVLKKRENITQTRTIFQLNKHQTILWL